MKSKLFLGFLFSVIGLLLLSAYENNYATGHLTDSDREAIVQQHVLETR